jgi:hypothetical protein
LVDASTSLDQVIEMAGGLNRETPPLFVRIQKGPKIFVLDLNQYYNKGEDHAHIAGWLGGETVFFQKDLADSLKDRLPPSPYRQPITLLGEVRKPGEYPVKMGNGFVDLLAQAGGFTEAADLDHLELIRRRAGGRYAAKFSWSELGSAPAPVEGDIIVVHADRQSKFERRFSLGMLLAGLLASVAAVVVSTKR